MEIHYNQKYYLLVPVILSCLFALIITLSNNFPLSWDIFTHINYSLAYLHDGITSVDYLLNAPAGKTIGYPPLFHILLIIFHSIFGISFIDVARILQVVLCVLNIFTITYVAAKIFDEKVGMFAGIILISSFMFTRFLLPIPETLAMIFFTLTIFSYYKASSEENYVYSVLASVLAVLTLATHFSSFVYLMMLLIILAIIQTILLKNIHGIEYYVYVMIPLFFFGIFVLLMLFVLSPSHLGQLLEGLFSIIFNPFSLLMGQVAMGLERYIKCVGILSLILSIIGLYYSFKNKEYLFISLWALIAFLITNLHWFGIPVYTFRLLIYLTVPMVILGAYGFSNILEISQIKNYNRTKILIIALIILSILLGFIHIMDSSVNIFSSTTEESTYVIAPPTSEEVEVINWFANEDVNNQSILSNNLFFATVISSSDEIPIHYAFDVYTNKSLTASSYNSLKTEQIGYILYDKNLIMKNESDFDKLDVRFVNGSYYPSYYFTKKIDKNNFNEIKLQSSEKVFENNRFIICKIN